MIYFIDINLVIIFLLIVGLSMGYTIVTNIGAILFMINAIIAFFGGGYLFFKGLTKKGILQKISSCLKSLMIMTIFLYITLLIEAAAPSDDLSRGSLIVISHFKFLQKDIFVTGLIISIVLLGLVILPVEIMKGTVVREQKNSMLLACISIVLVIAAYVIPFQIAIKDTFNNNIDRFDMQTFKYETLKTVDIRNEDLYYIKTGSFKSGTKLYGRDYGTEERNGVEYTEVTDGKKLGYVPTEDLKTLY